MLPAVAKTVAWCIIAALGVAALSACGVGGDAPPQGPGVTATGTVLAAWIARSVSPEAEITTDDAANLIPITGAGVPVGSGPAVASGGGVERYLVSVAADRDSQAREVSAGIVALPVARFDDGSSAVVVDLLVTGSATAARTVLAQDAARRVAAGAGLLANPAVTVCDACRTALATGGLDLRAASLIAVLTDRGPVAVQDVAADPAETLAGRPARTMTLAGPTPGALRALAAATVGGYRPTITAVRGASTTVTWNLADTTTLTGV